LGISTEDQIGGATTPYTFNGGVLQVRDNNIHNLDTHPFNNTSFNGGFDILDGGNTFTVTQTLSGTGSVRKLGLGTLVLSASNSYTGGTTLSGGYINTNLDANLGAASGSITINGTATLLTSASIISTRQINIGASGGTFDTNGFNSTFAAVLTGTGTFAKQGGETLTTNGYRPNNLQLNGGTLAVSAGRDATGKVSIVTSIGYNGGNLDLGENDLIVNYSATSQATANLNAVFAHVNQGYNGGNWQGGGITSNAAAAQSATAHPTALGYAEASTIGGLTSFDGVTTDSTMIVVRYTYAGDANLDGRVNALDFNILASNYGTGLVWAKGDFDYNNSVDTNDFNLLARNFNVTPLPAGGLGALVPEPVSATLVAMGVGLLLSRRRR
jgi:fibronectin-binding autotransporter adhesin